MGAGHSERQDHYPAKHDKKTDDIKDKTSINQKAVTCFYCKKMRRKTIDHEYFECESLLQVRPNLRKRKVVPVTESDSESEDEIEVETGCDDQEEGLVTLEENVLNLFRELPFEDSETDEDDERIVINSTPRPLLEPPDVDSSITATDEELSDEVVGRETVIHHDGACCPEPEQRARLGGRSLPGRAVDERHRIVGSIPGRLVHAGDVIRYFTGWLVDNEEQWLRATVRTMTKRNQEKYPNYYNILNEQGEEKSLELLEGGAW